MADWILNLNPKIVGFSVYIWNVQLIEQVVILIKKINPQLIVVLGGPEVSFEFEQTHLFSQCDYLITGEGERAFYQLSKQLLQGNSVTEKVHHGGEVDVTTLKLPYDFYTDEDIQHKMLLVEVSRGCPFKCEFCLSSLCNGVRSFPLDSFLAAMEQLISRGARKFKFADRTFNLDFQKVQTILEFFLKHIDKKIFLHFEVVPDRFSEDFRQLIRRFPQGSLQFEIGIQTLNQEVSQNISRRINKEKIKENIQFLNEHTQVNIHADLILGLPGDTLQSFATTFNELIEMNPQEIQIELLKKLKGAPIGNRIIPFQLKFSPYPPYEVLETSTLSFKDLRELEKFGQYWEQFANKSELRKCVSLLWESNQNPFAAFNSFAQWLFHRTKRTHSIAMKTRLEYLYEYLYQVLKLDQVRVKNIIQPVYETLLKIHWKVD